MKKHQSKPSATPKFLCCIRTDGRAPKEVAAKALRTFGLTDRIERMHLRRRPLESAAYQLGVIYSSEIPRETLMPFKGARAAKFPGMPEETLRQLRRISGEFITGRTLSGESRRRGLRRPPPQIALNLREAYTQRQLLKALNDLRPSGCPEVKKVVVLHRPIFVQAGLKRHPFLTALDRAHGKDFLTPEASGDKERWDNSCAFVGLMPY